MTTKTRAAEFSGHCQACGHLQKLPNAVLSLHGYNVTSGYFSGTCVGAKHPPFEVSCQLVAQFVADAQAQLGSIEAFQATLRRPATVARAWMHVRYETTRVARTSGMTRRIPTHAYRWEEVDLLQAFTPLLGAKTATDGYYVYSFVDRDGKVHGGSVSDQVGGTQRYASTKKNPTALDLLLETCATYNARYATWLEHEADSLRRYITWQAERVRTWAPASLLPVSHKDAAGFEPTAPSY